jgi:hypothetical protein
VPLVVSQQPSWVEAQLPKAPIQDRGYRRARPLTDLVCKLVFDFVKLGDHVTLL